MSHLTADDGVRLFRHDWPVREPRAIVCLVHGLGEHAGRYRHVAGWFNARQLGVTAIDLRGHGRSPGRRGHAVWDRLLDDIDLLLADAAERTPEVPLVLYGHSLGGVLAIDHALHRNRVGSAVVATSPALRPAFEPPARKIRSGRIAARLVPRLSFTNEVDTGALARDPEVERRYLADSLVHDRISAALGIGVLDAGERCLGNAAALATPLLLMHGEADRIADPAASREFAAAAGEACALRLWPDGYHELHNDPDWEQLMAAMMAWTDDQRPRARC